MYTLLLLQSSCESRTRCGVCKMSVRSWHVITGSVFLLSRLSKQTLRVSSDLSSTHKSTTQVGVQYWQTLSGMLAVLSILIFTLYFCLPFWKGRCGNYLFTLTHFLHMSLQTSNLWEQNDKHSMLKDPGHRLRTVNFLLSLTHGILHTCMANISCLILCLPTLQVLRFLLRLFTCL